MLSFKFLIIFVLSTLHISCSFNILKLNHKLQHVRLSSSPSISIIDPQKSNSRKFNILNYFPRKPMFKVFKKAINPWGIVFGVQCWAIMLLWFVGMLLFMPIKTLFGNRIDKDGILIDSLGRWWSRLVSFPHSLPRVTGVENLPPKNEACIYIANHASWMDIPILGGFLPPLKFVCKKELTKVALKT